MEKYLFTDRTNAVREVQSQQELQSLIDASEDPLSIRIWIFRSQAWIDLETFRKRQKTLARPHDHHLRNGVVYPLAQGKKWLKQFMFTGFFLASVLLVYNFAKIKWAKASPVSFIAPRPGNVPVMDLDSLIQEIEFDRGLKLDKTTRNNLRIRNNWPERLVMQLTASRDSSGNESRYHDLQVSIDNSSGFMIDEALIKFIAWFKGRPVSIDTIRFHNISYALTTHRKLNKTYTGDSLSVAFEQLRARGFNFCYSAGDKKSGSIDPWFCKEGK